MTTVSDIFGGAKNSIKNDVGVALGQLSQGNISGAVSTLASGGLNLVNNAVAQGGAAFGDDMAGMNARSDAIQNWCWYCILPTLYDKGALPLTLNGLVNYPSLQPAVSLPWYYVEEADTPLREITSKSVDRNGHLAHYADSYTVDGLSLTFFMDDANKAMKYLQAWQGLMLGNGDPSKMSNQGVWGFPKDYKKDISIAINSVNKKQLIICKYIGCSPKNAAALQLGSGSANALKLTVPFNVDDVSVTVLNTKGVLDNVLSTASGYAISALNNFNINTVQDALNSLD